MCKFGLIATLAIIVQPHFPVGAIFSSASFAAITPSARLPLYFLSHENPNTKLLGIIQFKNLSFLVSEKIDVQSHAS
jgi:hypothetical protein